MRLRIFASMLLVRSSPRDYGWALLVVVFAIALRLLIDPVLGDRLPFYLFYFAVMVAAAFTGAGPAMLVLAISLVSGIYFFVAPRYSFSLGDDQMLLNAFRFITLGAVIAVAGGWMRARHAQWRHELAERKAREAEMRRRMEESVSALASIGDGLITVDTEGRITFMNAIAEELCGWPLADAQGEAIDQVFKLESAEEDKSMENPALLSLRERRVVTVPRGTWLIQRSGLKRPIDDSAAPIRDAGGSITGAVIVFRSVDEVDDERAFMVLGVHLYPADGSQLPLMGSQRKALETACRKWIEREWQVDGRAVRLVALNGYDLFVRQESTEDLAGGRVGVRFNVSHQR